VTALRFRALELADTHCHLHEYDERDVLRIGRLGLKVLAVSDDYESSLRTLVLSRRHLWVVPAVGLHPWSVDSESIRLVDKIIDLALEHGVKAIGEVGLDKKFAPHTIDLQRIVFIKFVEYARAAGAVLTIHAVNTWREVLEILERYDVNSAVLHWYTGPAELLSRIRSMGMFIGVNPSIKIQEKHRRVVEKAPLEILLPESDGPYKYRGLMLDPSMIKDVIEWIAKLKGLSIEEATDVIRDNIRRFFRSL